MKSWLRKLASIGAVVLLCSVEANGASRSELPQISNVRVRVVEAGTWKAQDHPLVWIVFDARFPSLPDRNERIIFEGKCLAGGRIIRDESWVAVPRNLKAGQTKRDLDQLLFSSGDLPEQTSPPRCNFTILFGVWMGENQKKVGEYCWDTKTVEPNACQFMKDHKPDP
jgi:hypothetical protein